MALEYVAQRINATNLDTLTKKELMVLLGNMVDYLTALTAKLDADAGVTDTNYGAALITYLKR